MGIAFVVLFVAGFLMFPTPGMSSHRVSNVAKWSAWWTHSNHRVLAIVAAYLMVLGALAFVWFATSLPRTVRRNDDGRLRVAVRCVGDRVGAGAGHYSWWLDLRKSDDPAR
jgi:hypothetical protein